jgi:hypothetical protein
MINGIDFEWSVAHRYEIEPSKDNPARRVIRQVGKGSDPTRPLELPTLLAVAFSELDGSPEQCLKFARSYGLLRTPAGKGPELFDGPDGWLHSIKLMKSVINATTAMVSPSPRWPRIRMPLELAKVEIALVSGLPDPRPTLVLQPVTLWDAMIVQFAQFKASGNNEMVICEYCNKWFKRGINGKRSDARFCSRSCQNKFDYRKRRAGK